jgi:HIV Tat-specific factor 1
MHAVYFQPGSVPLAIEMADETDFRWGQKLPTGPMRVQPADVEFKDKKTLPDASNDGKPKANKTKNRQAVKKAQEMQSRLADWSDDEPQALPPAASSPNNVVVIKKMFTPKTFAELTIKELEKDVFEDAKEYGKVRTLLISHRREAVEF